MLNLRMEGEGPPLLLLHGFGIPFSIWQNLAPLLRPHFRLIMAALPGFDDSPPLAPGASYYIQAAESIEQVRVHLKIDTWNVLSYSCGARAAEQYVYRWPDRVRSQVLICPLRIPGWRWRTLQMLARVDAIIPSVGDYLLSGWRLFELVRWLGFNGRRSQGVHAWAAEITAQPMEALKAMLRDVPDPGEALRDLPGSNLFIWGVHDLVAPPPRRLTTNDRLVEAGHNAPQQAADAIATHALTFIDGSGCTR